MPLGSGSRLGPYEVLGLIGSGGMGEVYRARDTQLKRDVALKVLPAQVSADPDRLARFQREAELLAAFNHPHIAQIHGLVHDAGTPAIVMELVEGQTLADRITRGAVPLDEALPIAQQLADALEYAHERGIIHRDLKPANIKLTPDGAVKVLDFGLAKALIGDAAGAPSDLADSPTMTSPVHTRLGVILGTAAYMAPEQARGRPVDRRADIWAFGCVLFEMLTGRLAFPGDDVSDTLASVLRSEPAWTDLPADTPPGVRRVLRRCLVKDARQRLGDIRDARLEIEEATAGSAADAEFHPTPITPSPVGGASRWQKAAWALAGVSLAAAVLLALVLTGVWPRAAAPEPRPLTVSLVHDGGRDVGTAAISPDGTRVAYGARRADGMPMLWVQDVSSGEARVLEGTEGAAMPFWSPDSRDIGFFAGPSLKRVPAAGGSVQVVAPGVGGRGGAWALDDTIIFGADDAELLRVSAAPGSAPAPLTKLQGNDWLRVVDRAGAGRFVGDPQWFTYLMDLNPDGRRLAVGRADRSSATTDVWIVDLQTGGRQPVTASRGYAGVPAWSPDGKHLAYAYQPPGQRDDVYVRDMTTGRVVHKLESPDVLEHPVAWSHDGSSLVVWARGKGSQWLVRWALGSKEVTPLVESTFPLAALAPDDRYRYLAYTSVETGRAEAVVTTFPSPGQRWPLTSEGGHVLSWSKDGREILVATLSGHIVAYPVSTTGGFAAGLPTVVVRDVGFDARFSVATPDHSRIVVRVSPDAEKDKGEIRLLFDWQQRLGPALHR